MAIVISILAAFAIDPWWGIEQQREHLALVLEGLAEGYAEYIALVDENIDYVAADQVLLHRFIEMEPSEVGEIPSELTWLTLQANWRPGTHDDNITFLATPLEDESLRLIRSPQLHRAIASWQAQVDELDERADQMAAAERDALRILAKHAAVR